MTSCKICQSSHRFFEILFFLDFHSPVSSVAPLAIASWHSLFSKPLSLAFTSSCCLLTAWLFSTISVAVITCMQTILEFLSSVQTLCQSSPIFQFFIESFHRISHKYLKFNMSTAKQFTISFKLPPPLPLPIFPNLISGTSTYPVT